MSELDEPEFDFASSLIIFSETKQDDLASRFRREADAYYIEAKRSLVSSISQIPAWIYGVMFLLGWNEIIAVIRSPLYFTALAVLAGVAYVIFQMNMVSLSTYYEDSADALVRLVLFYELLKGRMTPL